MGTRDQVANDVSEYAWDIVCTFTVHGSLGLGCLHGPTSVVA